MYIRTIEGGFIDSNEPELGSLPDEEEIVEDYENEIVDAIQAVADSEEDYPEYITLIDSMSGEQVDILVSDYTKEIICV